MWHHQKAITIFYNKDKMQHSFNVLFEITKFSDHKFIKNINLDNRNRADTENWKKVVKTQTDRNQY
jgi:hypothetical protein